MKKFNFNKIMNKFLYVQKIIFFYIFNIDRNFYINNKIYLYIVLLIFYVIFLNLDLNYFFKNCKQIFNFEFLFKYLI